MLKSIFRSVGAKSKKKNSKSKKSKSVDDLEDLNNDTDNSETKRHNSECELVDPCYVTFQYPGVKELDNEVFQGESFIKV